MKRLITLSILSLALGNCAFYHTPAIDVTEVSFDWNNTIWDTVSFTVMNTGDVALDAIDIYFTAHCGGGDFDQIATFPEAHGNPDSPVAVGSTCDVEKILATLTGGATSIEITQVVVDYETITNRILTYTKTFLKP